MNTDAMILPTLFTSYQLRRLAIDSISHLSALAAFAENVDATCIRALSRVIKTYSLGTEGDLMAAKGSFHSPREETASLDELRAMQSERLCRVVRHVYDKNTTRRARFREVGLAPEDIRGLDDLRKIPTMDKSVLRANYPLRLSCVSKKQILEMHMSSGRGSSRGSCPTGFG